MGLLHLSHQTVMSQCPESGNVLFVTLSWTRDLMECRHTKAVVHFVGM